MIDISHYFVRQDNNGGINDILFVKITFNECLTHFYYNHINYVLIHDLSLSIRNSALDVIMMAAGDGSTEMR